MGRVHSRNTKHITDSRVRRRASALTQNFRLGLMTRKIDDLFDGQEILGNIQLCDHHQFFAQGRFDMVRHAVRVTVIRTLPCQFLKIGLRGVPLRHRLVGVFIG